MPSKPTPDFAILDAWREQGADRLNPLAFHYMLALQRRVAAYDGDARQALQEKLSTRIADYAAELERTTPCTANSHSVVSLTALATLSQELDLRASARNMRTSTSTDTASHQALPEMVVLQDLRKLWSRVHTRSQVRRSLQPSPENTGPLNSSHLVHRSLTLMRATSPGYLEHFLAYSDALSWLQQLGDHGVLAAQDTVQPARMRPRAPRKPRPPR